MLLIQMSLVRRICWLLVSLAASIVVASFACKGYLRFAFGWAIHPGFWLASVYLFICILEGFRTRSFISLTVCFILYGVAMSDFPVPHMFLPADLVVMRMIAALTGIASCQVALSLTLSINKTLVASRAIIIILTIYVQAVHFFNALQLPEIMHFFGEGGIV